MKYLSLLFLVLVPLLPVYSDEIPLYTWRYDRECNLLEFIENSPFLETRTTKFEFDPVNRTEKIVKPDGIVLYRIFDKKNLSRLKSSDGTVDYEYFYDDAGRVEYIHNNAAQTTTRHEYNISGKLSFTLQENGLSLGIEYSPDSFSWLLPDSSSVQHSFENNRISRIARKTPSGTELYACGFKGNRESFPGKAGTLTTVADDGFRRYLSTGLWEEEISEDLFDEHNRIKYTRIKDPLGNVETAYDYDEEGRLALWTCTNRPHEKYFYDSLGNRIESGQEIGGHNQTLSHGNIRYTYDLNGNLTCKTSPEGSWTFRYDALDRMIEAEKPGEWKAEYNYDCYHRRQRKTLYEWDRQQNVWIKKERLLFLYFGSEEIGCFDDQGYLKALRIISREPDEVKTGTKLIELPSGVYAAVEDHQGNIRCLIDIKTGAVKEFYRFAPFGEESLFDYEGAPMERDSAENPWRYYGKRHDPETGFIFFGYRYYSPEISKWTTPDPIGCPDGPNRYLFMQNNPANRTDTAGYFSLPLPLGKIKQVYSYLHLALSEYRKKYQSDEAFDEAVRDCVKFLTGNGLLFSLSNYSEEPPIISTIDGKIQDPGQRITFINGIMNNSDAMQTYAKVVSERNEGSAVHYIYRGTGGWTKDILRCILIRFGYISQDARNLANLWKELIYEMGGTDSGGRIIHWAHSMGGAETLRARSLMTPEELQMIHVTTFGSPIIVPNEGFGSVLNRVSYRDGVAILDTVNYIHALLFRPSHVELKGSFLDGYPLVDHPFDAYMKYLEESLEKE